MKPHPIYLFNDFGLRGPYQGQMQAVVARWAPGARVVSLMADAPRCAPTLAAPLLAALVSYTARPGIFVCVVDPGVGSSRRALMIELDDGSWLIGPDNGLLLPTAERLGARQWREITWRPEALSESFHGRDLFTPAAVRLWHNDPLSAYSQPIQSQALVRTTLPEWVCVYIDHFGNLFTNRFADELRDGQKLPLCGRTLEYCRTFSEAPPQTPFWYRNSQGLVEIAVNGGSARECLGVELGDRLDRA